MKKIFVTALILCLSCSSLWAQHSIATKANLSAATSHYLHAVQQNGQLVQPDYVYKIINNKTYISALIKVLPTANADWLKQHTGVLIGTQAGDIWTAQIPVDNFNEFIHAPGICQIDLDIPILPCLDSARRRTNADSAQMGYFLPSPMTGKNVITGIIDAGFDLTHPTFYDTSHSQYRIKKVWLQKLSGTPPAGYLYGREITDTNVMRTVGYDTTVTSHGTHVAGIAAGSGSGSSATSSQRFRGFAYESDIVMVGIMPAAGQWINTGVSDIVDGMNYIFTYATSVGKPAVVNLSWGSTLGPHDGSSLFSQACDNLTGSGKIFVCAAGNNGTDTVHLQKTFTAVDTVVHTFVAFSPYLDSNTQNTYVDVWGDTGKNYCLRLRLFNAATAIDSTIKVCLSVDSVYNFHLKGSNNDTCFITIAAKAVEYNMKPHAYIFLHSKVHDNICLSVSGTDGVVDMWEGYVLPPVGYYGALRKAGYSFATAGDVNMTVSDIGSTRSAITVGAFATKVSFKNISNVNLAYTGAVRGKIASFSSLGPTADYRIKPDITAPGFGVVSAVSSFSTEFTIGGSSYDEVITNTTSGGRTYPYAIFAGTSMASPCVSGIVAMMLQMNPTLKPDSVKAIINYTAFQDTYTGVLPSSGTNTWGHGKINAYRALRYMNGNLSSVSQTGMDAMDCILYPNPGKGLFTIDYNAITAELVTVTVSDLAGNLVKTFSWVANSGHNHKSLDLTGLTAGMYITRVAGTSGAVSIKTMIQ